MHLSNHGCPIGGRTGLPVTAVHGPSEGVTDLVAADAGQLPDLPENYESTRDALVATIHAAQDQAALSVNVLRNLAYLEVGRSLSALQPDGPKRGARVLEELSADLTAEFGRGYGRSNLNYMRQFARMAQEPSVQSTLDARARVGVLQLPWGAITLLCDKFNEDAETFAWYVRAYFARGWNLNQLTTQVNARLHEREGRAANNLPATAPDITTALARQLSKEPFEFGFVSISPDASEKAMEDALTLAFRRCQLRGLLRLRHALLGRDALGRDGGT